MMDKRENCFGFLRLIISLSVVYQHVSTYYNLPNIKLINWIDKVPLFFFISAYTIMLSLDSNEVSFKKFSIKRFMRLYPEMWLAIILEIFLLLIQFPSLSTNIQFYLWIIAQFTLFQFWTPDCLRFYGIGTPNGSLWTNIVFIQFYMIIYFMFKYTKKINLKKDIVIMVALVGINCLLSLFDGYIDETIFKLLLQTIFPYIYMFYFGVIFYKYSDKLIPLSKKYFWILLLLFVVFSKYNYVINFIPHTYNTGTVLHVLICMIFFFAFAYKFPNLKIKKDYSYGIYIYHMIVVNYIYHNNLIENEYMVLFVTYLVTFFLAIASNKLINKTIKKTKAV